MKLPERPRPEYKEPKAKAKAPATVGLIEHWRKLESEGKTRGRIENMLDKINFIGGDETAKKNISGKMMKLIKKHKMNEEEVNQFIRTIKNELDELSVYAKEGVPTEMVQSFVSLLSTGEPGHFLTVVPKKREKELFQSLPKIASNIVKDRKK